MQLRAFFFIKTQMPKDIKFVHSVAFNRTDLTPTPWPTLPPHQVRLLPQQMT